MKTGDGRFVRMRVGRIEFKLAGSRTSKQVGELAEAAFLTKAASMGLGVSKPWGDSMRYDFVVDNGDRMFRVQVKATVTRDCQSYLINTRRFRHKRAVSYTGKEIDFVVGYVAPLDRWYVVPVEAVRGLYYFRAFVRKTKRAKFEQYREAWGLLKGGW